jgi:hypothetical protein
VILKACSVKAAYPSTAQLLKISEIFRQSDLEFSGTWRFQISPMVGMGGVVQTRFTPDKPDVLDGGEVLEGIAGDGFGKCVGLVWVLILGTGRQGLTG